VSGALLILLFCSCHHTRKLTRSKYKETTVTKSESRPAKKATAEAYIAQWKDAAVHQMKKYGIPASITLAQGMLESANGNSELAREANNHFGIKCTGDWKGATYYHKAERGQECFRKYKSADESFADHTQFLKNKRYASLFRLKSTDYKGWARGLKEAGYATNPQYPQLLINLIEKYHLDDYDE